jgi:molecular chaperone GrpE
VSKEKQKRAADASGSASQEEESAGALPPNPELEEALREAAESLESEPRASEEGAEQEPEEGISEGEEGISEGEEALDPVLELEKTQNRLLRLQADFENFRRRALAERRDIYQFGHQNLVKDLLLTVDNLDRAIGHARESGGGDLESFLQGVDLVQRELLGVLEAHSVHEVEALGKAFDPALHEAMAQAVDESVAPNTVIDVLEKGYQLRDRLLRPARVIVAKAPEPDSEDGGEAAD